jgi:hypothetical protein
MRLHLLVKDFHMNTLVVTEALFQQKPWRLETNMEREAVAQVWADKMAEIYEVPPVKLVIGDHTSTGPADSLDEDVGNEDTIGDNRRPLHLSHWSFVVLFKRWREHMNHYGHIRISGDPEQDARGWAYSLFYRVRPIMFRARVREGRIPGVEPDDLLKTETIRERDTQRAREEMAEEADAEFQDIEISDDPVVTASVDPSGGLDSVNRDGLRALAKTHNISGRGSMTADQLRSALREARVGV